MKIQEILKSDIFPALTGIYDNPHLIIDMRGNIFFSNKASKNLLGLTSENVNIFDIFSGKTSELFYYLIKKGKEKEGTQLIQLDLRSGVSIKMQLRYSFIEDEEDKFLSCQFSREELKARTTSELRITGESESVFNQDLLSLIKQNFPFTYLGRDSVRRKADELKELFWIKDASGKFILVNRSFAEYMSMQAEKIEGSEEEKFIPEYLRKACSGITDYILNSGKPVKSSGILFGSSPYMKERIEVPLVSRDNKVIAIAGMTIPANGGNKKESVQTIEIIPKPAVLLSVSGISVQTNEDFRKLFNIDRKNVNIHLKNLFPTEVSAFIEQFLKSDAKEETRAFTSNEVIRRTYPYGCTVLLKKIQSENQVLVCFDELKSPGDMQDTSTLKGKVYDILIQSNPQPVFIYEKENLRFIDVNQSALNLYGFSKSEFLQMDLTDLYAPEDIQTLLGALNEKIKEGEFSGPFRQKKKDGSFIYVEVSKFALKFSGKDAHFNILRDVTQKLTAEKESSLFKAAFDNSEQLIFVTDSSGFIKFVNNAVIDSLGYTKTEIEKTSFSALVKDQERATVNSSIFKSPSKTLSELNLQLKNAKGELLPALVKAYPQTDYRNEVDTFTLIASLKKEEKVKEVTKEIVVERVIPSDNQAPGDPVLISSIFHEILTPINVILGFVQEITDSIQNPSMEQKEAAEIISQNRTSLLNTMNSIVEYYNFEKKSPDMNLMQVSAREIIDKLQEDFRELSRSRGIEVGYGKITSSFFFETDKSKFSNLIFLLCKMAGLASKDKKIYLSLYPVDKDRFAVTFKNAADASTPAFIEELIRVFSTGLNGGESDLPKMSVRLVNRLVDLFEAEIYVKSDNSEVGFSFPIKTSIPELRKFTISSEEKKIRTAVPMIMKKAVTEPAVPRKTFSKETFLNMSQLRCLYLEDQIDSQILYKVQMKDLGDIQFAASFEEALPMLDKKHFDFIVMDINLQGEYNGLDALRIIKKMPEFRNIPVIAVTAYLLPGDREKFITAGFNEFVAKPIFRERMIEALERVLQRK